jgi:putative effector of murein hydrolase LrgA (UPF0299 family)
LLIPDSLFRDIERKWVRVRFLFLILAFLFFGVWLVSFVMFHIAGGLVHLLLVIGVVALVIHFIRGARAA